jgi:ADP-L-glycero-D-manno-heptose 6-epimerase
MVSHLNKLGFTKLYLMDDFSREDKKQNYENLQFISLVERSSVDNFLQKKYSIDAVIHFGAKTDTTEMRYEIHEELNLHFSKKIWKHCAENKIPLVYASSAATYGDGAFGYSDDHHVVEKLQPLNPYGVSKNEFDKWALQQTTSPPNWFGLKFFNVFGPNEYHKGRMASVVYHAYHQIKKTNTLKLFRSHHPDYADGGQLRDFIYVKDLLNMVDWLLNHIPDNGLYNIGTGKAEPFLSLGKAVFSSMNIEVNIEFIDTPIDIRDKYQYFTQADMTKLRTAGYDLPCYSLQEAVDDYVKNYLEASLYL